MFPKTFTCDECGRVYQIVYETAEGAANARRKRCPDCQNRRTKELKRMRREVGNGKLKVDPEQETVTKDPALPDPARESITSNIPVQASDIPTPAKEEMPVPSVPKKPKIYPAELEKKRQATWEKMEKRDREKRFTYKEMIVGNSDDSYYSHGRPIMESFGKRIPIGRRRDD